MAKRRYEEIKKQEIYLGEVSRFNIHLWNVRNWNWMLKSDVKICYLYSTTLKISYKQ